MIMQTRSPMTGVEVRRSLQRVGRRTRDVLDRVVAALRNDRKTRAAVAGVAVAVTAGLLARARRRH